MLKQIKRVVCHKGSILSLPKGLRYFSSEVEEPFADRTDVLVVGAGPAGLSAAIKLKQIAQKENTELRVVVLEKAGEIGAHTLSGAVIETRALEELFPNWKDMETPIKQPATKDMFKVLTKNKAFPFPHPPQMNNKGNYIVSLNKLVKWLGEQAESLGVEIYSGYAGSSVVYKDDKVVGVKTNDVGLNKSFKKKESYEPGMELRSNITLFAEGCHGSLTKQIIKKYNLRENGFQTYGLGIKEVWELDTKKHRPGLVVHTIGWPMNYKTYGGSWMYHMEDNLLSIGFVIGLDYSNTYLNPYKEFQRFKHHPFIKDFLEGGKCISYGARTLVEGGYQSIPKLVFPGGALIGDTAGFLNVPKIKGTHTAMKSGIIAAESIYKAFKQNNELLTQKDSPILLKDYEDSIKNSWVFKELYQVRNIRPSFGTRLGIYGGILYSGIDSLLLKGRVPWTFKHHSADHLATKLAKDCKPIEYPKPDGLTSFNLLENLSRSNTNHEEDQPVHLRLKDPKLPQAKDYPSFKGIEERFCPAGVYEYLDDNGTKKLHINAQNCVHCKTCDIKSPSQNIDWTVPEGGGGPQYYYT